MSTRHIPDAESPTQATPVVTPRVSSAVRLRSTRHKAGSNNEIYSLTLPVEPSPSMMFLKTVEDLEGLLDEALNIARLAADEREVEHLVTSLTPVDTPAYKFNIVSATPGRVIQTSDSDHSLTSLPSRSNRASQRFAVNATERNRHRKLVPVCPWEPGRLDELRTKSSVTETVLSNSSREYWGRHTHQDKTRLSMQRLGVLASSDPAAVSRGELLGHILRRQPSKQNLQSQDGPTVRVRASDRRLILPDSTSRRPRRLLLADEDTDIEDDYQERYEGKAAIGQSAPSLGNDGKTFDGFRQMFGLESSDASSLKFAENHTQCIELNGCRHVDVKGLDGFNSYHICRQQLVARDWTTPRKRFAAAVACVNTALIGMIIGIYAGEVPAIQYVIVDLSHHTILGNVVLYLGLAMPTMFLWPLPLMHGRKPYVVMALAVALCFQIPQGIAVSNFRSPRFSVYHNMLLLSRAASGLALGFVNINLQATLLDLFGASLQSGNPYQETLDPYDVRRHGGGMGLWLGIWSWCSIGSISVGFFIGTLIVDGTDVEWGFWTSLMLLMAVLLLNIAGPEVRRSAYRRTVAEVLGDEGYHISCISPGEVKMHLRSTGPYWWGEEVKAGAELCWRMFRQPGFAVLAVYAGWAYAYFTLVLMLLGALASRYYRLKPVQVGGCVLSLGLGALLATPFQRASFFSRARHHRQRTDSMTVREQVTWSSHIVRRALFTLLLPLAGVGYTLASRGPSISIAVPTTFATGVGFLSNLAIAECQCIVMEAFDTSDLQAGMIGRPTRRTTASERELRTNFSCYPRVSAGFAVSQGLSFCFAAIATGVCGRVERRLGAVQATGIVAGILMGLTVLLTIVLFRFRVVQIIPDIQKRDQRLMATGKSEWEPVVMGRPSGTTRKISLFEKGALTRWSEIRRKNRLTG